jgi:hypothetical protein
MRRNQNRMQQNFNHPRRYLHADIICASLELQYGSK